MRFDNVEFAFVCSFYAVLCVWSGVHWFYSLLPFVLWVVFTFLDSLVSS